MRRRIREPRRFCGKSSSLQRLIKRFREQARSHIGMHLCGSELASEGITSALSELGQMNHLKP